MSLRSSLLCEPCNYQRRGFGVSLDAAAFVMRRGEEVVSWRALLAVIGRALPLKTAALIVALEVIVRLRRVRLATLTHWYAGRVFIVVGCWTCPDERSVRKSGDRIDYSSRYQRERSGSRCRELLCWFGMETLDSVPSSLSRSLRVYLRGWSVRRVVIRPRLRRPPRETIWTGA